MTRTLRFTVPMLLLAAAAALPAMAKTVLLLPVSGETTRVEDISAINRLFLDAMEAGYSGVNVVTAPAGNGCAERACALEAAKAAGADEVVYSSIHKLGERWIFSATLVPADGVGPFNQRLTAVSIEDMEAVTRRMADALSSRKDVEQAATVDNVTRRENDEEPDRRRSLYHGGVALGYLFPAGNSYGYRTQHEDFFYDTLVLKTYSQMIRLTWLNSWEFRNNTALGVEAVWSLPHTVGLDFNMRYYFGRDDFSPFVGGGLGLHYVRGDEDGDADKRNSGPALNAQGGMLLFRTYDVNVMLRGQYQVILDSDVDHGLAVDVGVTLKNKDGGKSSSKSDQGSLWQGIAAAIVSIILIGIILD